MKVNRSGFTLIELVAAMSIMAVVITTAIASYVRYNQRQEARAVADKVRQVFGQAKANALSGKKDCVICGGTNQRCDGLATDLALEGWRVSIAHTSPASYTINGICGGTVFLSKQEIFPVNVTVSGTCNSITFDTNGETNLAPVSCSVIVSGGGLSYTVTVTRGGAVN